MSQKGLLRWPDGAGWLVLAGGAGAFDAGVPREMALGDAGAIDAAALAWTDMSRPMAFIPTASGSSAYGEALLADYADLGGPSGYVVPIYDLAGAWDRANQRALAEAGLIYIGDGEMARLLEAIDAASPTMAGLLEAYQEGAVIVGVGAGAVALGAWWAPEEGRKLRPAWAWLQDALVVDRFADDEAARPLRQLLLRQPGTFGLGVPPDTALALGPEGEVETLGDGGQITVILPQPGEQDG